eukprot:1066706-Pyramimonas_sp.AAC.1
MVPMLFGGRLKTTLRLSQDPHMLELFIVCGSDSGDDQNAHSVIKKQDIGRTRWHYFHGSCGASHLTREDCHAQVG